MDANDILDNYAKKFISKDLASDYDGSIDSLIPAIVNYGDEKQSIEIMVGTLAIDACRISQHNSNQTSKTYNTICSINSHNIASKVCRFEQRLRFNVVNLLRSNSSSSRHNRQSNKI